jgi:hypothetical protein
MRELLSLRRDEAPIVGEVYKYENKYLKCVVDSCSWCENCFFDVESCGKLCDKKDGALPRRHFERVPENEPENVADVKFRHIEETKDERPKKGEIFIASVGLVTLIDIADTRFKDCSLCDLTMSECDSCDCLPNHCYKKIPR